MALQKLETMHNGGGGCGVFNTADPEKYGLPEGYDFQTIMQGLVDATCGKTNHALIRRMVFKSGPAVEWLRDNIPGANLDYILLSGDHFGTAWAIDGWESTKDGIGIVGDWICNWAQENGGTILYETPATQLIKDDSGAVTGVIGQTADGGYVRVNATDGVILCTGDICDNEEMLERWFPEAIGLPHFNSRDGLDGDAVKMGSWVGAAVEPVVDRFNGFVDQGADEDYFLDPEYLKYAGIKEGPFYAFHYTNGINCVDAGLLVDDEMRVLNENGEAIPGLWAAGNASGGMFGPDYPARYLGFSVGRSVTGGMVAVQSILGTVEEDF